MAPFCIAIAMFVSGATVHCTMSPSDARYASISQSTACCGCTDAPSDDARRVGAPRPASRRHPRRPGADNLAALIRSGTLHLTVVAAAEVAHGLV